MEKETKTFVLKINGETIIEVEASGSKSIVDSFEKNAFTDTFGIFYKFRDEFGKMFLNGVQIKMDTIFRDKKGKFIKPEKIIKGEVK